DYGATWTKIVNGIPSDDFVRATREDPTRAGLLYAASERTVYVSWDDGANWQSLGLNLPNTQVSDLVVEENDLVIGTHGRSFWVMRNIAPLRQMNARVAAAPAHLFDPVDPRRGIDNGVDVYYTLAEDAERVTLEFLDGSGEVIQRYEGTAEDEEEEEEDSPFAQFFGGGGGGTPSTDAGSNRFSWNLRYPGYVDFDGRIFWAARNAGPVAVPGPYTVRPSVVDLPPQEQQFEIRLDPRLEGTVTLAELQERFDLAIQIRDRVSDANQAVIDIRGIKTDVTDRMDQTDDQEIDQTGEEVNTKLTGVESEIYQIRNQSNQDPLNFPIKLNNKLAALMGVVESAEAPPTDQSYAVFTTLSTALDVQLQQMRIIIQEDVARLNELLREAGLETIRIPDLVSD
ncbi:MAG: glycosyl hydrolase, partial [Acidimicrobiia bacterium]|nr:glycosyl hydrolase [Acidimicrobiia bacterium]